MTVYDAWPSAPNSWIVHACAREWKAHTVFRDLSASTCSRARLLNVKATATNSAAPSENTNSDDDEFGEGGPEASASNRDKITSPPTPASGPGSIPTPSPTAAKAPSDASSSSSSSGKGEKEGKGGKGWKGGEDHTALIAGAVVGPIVALLAGALGFLFGTRRKLGAVPVENNSHVLRSIGDRRSTATSAASSVQKQASTISFDVHRSFEAPDHHRQDSFTAPPPFRQQRPSFRFPSYSPTPPWRWQSISTMLSATPSNSACTNGTNGLDPLDERLSVLFPMHPPPTPRRPTSTSSRKSVSPSVSASTDRRGSIDPSKHETDAGKEA